MYCASYYGLYLYVIIYMFTRATDRSRHPNINIKTQIPLELLVVALHIIINPMITFQNHTYNGTY